MIDFYPEEGLLWSFLFQAAAFGTCVFTVPLARDVETRHLASASIMQLLQPPLLDQLVWVCLVQCKDIQEDSCPFKYTGADGRFQLYFFL